jgi:hypothetical protein
MLLPIPKQQKFLLKAPLITLMWSGFEKTPYFFENPATVFRKSRHPFFHLSRTTTAKTICDFYAVWKASDLRYGEKWLSLLSESREL